MAAFIGELLIGWLLADLASGILHWLEDRMLRASWPIVGRYIVAPNRLHHLDPLAFTRCGVIERNWTSWIAVCLISAIWLLIAGPSVTWAAATIGGLVANEVHCWAHVPAATPAIFKPLQVAGIIQSPTEHWGHHRRDAAARYCVLTDLLNPLLDALRVWAVLEATLAAIGLRIDKEAV